MEKKDSKNKLLTALIMVVLGVIFVVGFIYGLNRVLAMEGAYPPSTNTEGITKAPETKEEALEFLNYAYKKAVDEKPQFSNERWYGIDEDTFETDFSDEFTETLKYLQKDVCSAVNSDFKKTETDFGEEFAKASMLPAFTAADIESFECDYIYYVCPSCGESDSEPHDSHPECGSDRPYELKYKDEYEITLHIVPTEAVINKNFAPRKTEDVLALVKDNYDGVAVPEKFSADTKELTVIFKVNRLTDKLTFLRYTRVLDTDLALAFTGDYEALGKGNVKFTTTRENSFYFTWPSLELNNDEMVIEPKGNDNLLATLTCSDPTAPVVTWKSSDENVVTVDEEGYMKASKTPGEAIVTASFEFNGKTYTDSCKILVRVEVESLSVNKRKAALNVGDTLTLTTKVTPAKATVTTVKWYTEDASVAAVDENGVVTAVASGVTKVYALSDDGYYKSSCEVTVK